jgi:hypothetical protein
MAPTNKDSEATQMAGAHIFQAVQHPKLDMLGLVAIRDFLKKLSTLPAAHGSEQQGGRRQRHADRSGGFDLSGAAGKPNRYGGNRRRID